jgi:uncharacterized membrane protein YphA (DoxX/SURF4 family)
MSLTITNLVTYFAIGGVILTGIIFAAKQHKALWMSFLQNFCGVWFLFSGFVKAVDPIGTSYKMEQYFAEFESTFAGLGWKNFAAIFPMVSKWSLGVSIATIFLEILLGIMLIVGIRNRLTGWIFFLLMFFFTVLTGYTYLTGYCPQGVNFFDFAKWGPWVETNMKVTDCGCFGDFIKLAPKTSFIKDCFLMIPSLLFLIFWRNMHVLFTRKARVILGSFSALAVLAFCYYNSCIDLPVIDFRPFKVGTNLLEKRAAEEKAAGDVEIIGYVLENEKTGEKAVANIPDGQDAAKYYMDSVLKQYPKDAGWKVVDQIKTESTVPHTKVSDFDFFDITENRSQWNEDVLSDKEYNFLVISNHLDYENKRENEVTTDIKKVVYDTIGRNVVQRDTILKKVETVITADWNPAFIKKWRDKIIPMTVAAKRDNKNISVIAHDSPLMLKAFQDYLGTKDATFYECDDIVLKTIIRSNPGVLLMKGGVVVQMWHINSLPSYDEIKAKYMK